MRLFTTHMFADSFYPEGQIRHFVGFYRLSAEIISRNGDLFHHIGYSFHHFDDLFRYLADSLHHLDAIFRGGKLLLSGGTVLLNMVKALLLLNHVLGFLPISFRGDNFAPIMASKPCYM